MGLLAFESGGFFFRLYDARFPRTHGLIRVIFTTLSHSCDTSEVWLQRVMRQLALVAHHVASRIVQQSDGMCHDLLPYVAHRCGKLRAPGKQCAVP